MPESTLILQGTWRDGVYGDHVVWHNPADIGHAFIGLRKHMAELRIIERMERRWADEVVVAAILGSHRRENWL
jgi:hypothetical protein